MRTIFHRMSLFLIFSLAACAPKSNLKTHNTPSDRFRQVLWTHPEKVWSDTLSDRVRSALNDYQSRKQLPNHRYYGDSVRHLNLKGKTVAQLQLILRNNDCRQEERWILDPKTQKPKLDAQQKPVPMMVYICPDGGAVRIKTYGDPTSRFRPQPHANKALRYPYDSKYETFEDEVLKIDNDGYAIPKSAQDLHPESLDPKTNSEWLKTWADDDHTDL